MTALWEQTKSVGDIGEDVLALYLRAHGHSICERSSETRKETDFDLISISPRNERRVYEVKAEKYENLAVEKTQGNGEGALYTTKAQWWASWYILRNELRFVPVERLKAFVEKLPSSRIEPMGNGSTGWLVTPSELKTIPGSATYPGPWLDELAWKLGPDGQFLSVIGVRAGEYARPLFTTGKYDASFVERLNAQLGQGYIHDGAYPWQKEVLEFMRVNAVQGQATTTWHRSIPEGILSNTPSFPGPDPSPYLERIKRDFPRVDPAPMSQAQQWAIQLGNALGNEFGLTPRSSTL
jgi:hypothetical protein